jgi:hypothetical protein
MAKAAPRTGRTILFRAARIAFASTVLFAAAVYAIDYLVLRVRLATHNHPTDTVIVRAVYAVPQKNGRTEYLAGDQQAQTCVRSLFPHMNDAPCWYLKRHQEQRVDM